MRKLYHIIVTLLCCLVLSGCSDVPSGAENAPTGAPDTSVTTPPTATPAPTEVPEGPYVAFSAASGFYDKKFYGPVYGRLAKGNRYDTAGGG